MNNTHIAVQTEDFDLGTEYQALVEDNTQDGGVALFVGRVREFNQEQQVTTLELEHYPAMTEKALRDIADQARQRWQINNLCIIHRVGKLELSDQIVLVGVTSPHREAAFESAQFLMDYLKTRAPFWKKETTTAGTQRWVEAQEKDQQAAKRW
ncbi:MAG: molybdopterin synthase catalytic subunit MoaE [Candidatus Pelagadaptatus aseana]|uniref:molybdopterin synthase catalytic subunit MoaE n=1 Tax=Candidatus Pelagadaptatus aseana TaxID=3120508 RepID=UPI0039B2AB9D